MAARAAVALIAHEQAGPRAGLLFGMTIQSVEMTFPVSRGVTSLQTMM
jgi:hypothetical protein